jgi:hypothetical protein
MQLKFESIQLEQQSAYLKIFDACPAKASDYSFINLWGWADIYGLEWAWSSGLVWIRQTLPETLYWAPVGNWGTISWKQTLRENFSGLTQFERIPKELLEVWQNIDDLELEAQPTRRHWDYLYSVSDLAELKGRKYHKKKNLLNQFNKNYSHSYISLGSENVHLTTQMQEDWCTWRDCAAEEALDSENRAILKILDNWEYLDRLMGGALMVDNRMVAYTVAEALADNILLIHFEKGDAEYKGVYQAINQIFLKAVGPPYQTVNREQDLSSEGMRKAKMSYHPIGFIEKYNVTVS